MRQENVDSKNETEKTEKYYVSFLIQIFGGFAFSFSPIHMSSGKKLILSYQLLV